MEHNKNSRYYRFTGIKQEWQWCYSATDLQSRLNQLVCGCVLQKMYTSFWDCKDGKCHGGTHLDLSFVGGYVLLIFDQVAMEFAIYGEGMVAYRFFAPDQIPMEEICGNEPDRFDFVYTNVVELREYFAADYAQKQVQRAEVGHTNIWSFHLNSFDVARADKAADANDLPAHICFCLADDVVVQLIGDQSEYCHILVK